MAYGKTHQGRFVAKNPQKYAGNPKDIIFRSSWEKKLMCWADNHPSVLSWGSETVKIPYVKPLTGKIHTYYPDFLLKMKNKEGRTTVVLIEVKPYAQTIMPEQKKGAHKKKFLREAATYSTNYSKWEAAKRFCAQRGWKFLIMTEYELGIKKGPK